MATYKVIQDIEAEDKLLGPLSLRQLIYAFIAIGSAFLAFKLAVVKWYLVFPFLPPMVLFGVLAAPFGREQSSEIWLLAKIRFILKPHLRIWDQNGVKQLVSITAPKTVNTQLTNNLSPNEVSSRLQALANTLDSRGWAIKNVNVNLFSEPSYVSQQASDRLVGLHDLPQDVPNVGVAAADDIMDEQSNPTAHHFQEMITASEQAHHQQLVSNMQPPTKSATQSQANQPDYWFMNSGGTSVPSGLSAFGDDPIVSPGSTPTYSQTTSSTIDEKATTAELRARHNKPNLAYGHMREIKPLSDQDTASTSVTTPVDPVIIDLANNDDLNVATIARQANLNRKLPDDEVVISLH